MAGGRLPGALAAAVVAGVFFVIGLTAVRGDEGRVTGTKHDVASPGEAVCEYCHVPHDPAGEALWAQRPVTGPVAGLKALCFSCHDGTVAAADDGYVFDPRRPEHPLKPGERGQDCDRCHDPHRAGYGNFIKQPGEANFCQSCHPRAGPMNHPVDVDAGVSGVAPEDSHWDPLAGDFSGTRLWDAEGAGPGGLVKCLTCHAPHGGQPQTDMNTVGFTTEHSSSLCQACHQRGGD